MKKRLVAFLLVLIMVLGMLPVSALAADGTIVYDGVTLHTNTKPRDFTFLRNNAEGNVTKDVGESGVYQRLPRYTNICSCGGTLVECIPDEYSANAQKTVELSDPTVLKDLSFTISGWSDDDFYSGDPCLTFNYTAAKPGTTNVKLTFYYNYNFDGASGTCKRCGRYANIPAMNTWLQETTTFTVTVTGDSGEDEKPDVTVTYTLNYHANGGDENSVPASQTEKSNTGKATFTVSSAIPTRDGYTFLGWADEADATAVQYHGGDKITLTKDNPTKTIYAVWKENPPLDIPNPNPGNIAENLKVKVVCTTPNSGHEPAFYSLIDGTFIHTDIEQSGDYPTCSITISPDKYISRYSTDKNCQHTTPDDPKTVPLLWNKEAQKWAVNDDQIGLNGVVFNAVCEAVPDTFTVTYTDGVDGEVFEDKVFSDLKSGEDTPAFGKDPYRYGYTFAGWEPEVAETVTANATYTAKWTPVEPTREDIFKALNGLVTVTCINRFWKDGNKNMDCGQGQYAAKAGIAGQDYTLVKGEDDTTWVVTFPVTNFVKSFKQDPAHNLYTKDTLSWYIRWEDNAWTSEPVESGVDDLVKLTHAPTDWREVAKIATGGKSDCIHTLCVNSGLNVCDYGITVPFVNFNEDVVSVLPEEGVPGSYIATFKVDKFVDVRAKACNDKNFPDAPRTHKLLTQETVQWRLYATPEADEKIGNNVLNHVWEAEPVEAGKDDVCTIAHNWVVTFDSYGGSKVDPQVVEYGLYAQKPADPTLEGFTFKYWYLDDENEAYDFENTPVTADITLTAKWEINKYTVTFDSYGGSKVDPQVVEFGLYAQEPEEPTLEGFTFKYWYLDDENEAYDFENTPVTADITLTAKWEINKFKVTFDTDGGEPIPDDQFVEWGLFVEEPTTEPTKTGYTFDGWYLGDEKYDFSAAVEQNITLTAKWEAKKANVHLMIFKSGDLSTPIVNVPYATDKLAGDTIDLAEIDLSSYLDFDFEIDGGWYDDGLFNLYKKYVNGEQENKPAALTELQINGNWQNLKLIVTELVPVVYYMSDADRVADNRLFATTARVGSALPTANAPTATREGYTFTFWSREGQLGTDVTGQTVNGWTNLVANWKVTPHNIYAYARLNSYFAPLTTKEFDTPITLNEATLSRLGLGSYNSLGYISIGSFTFDAMPLTSDLYFADDAELSAVAEKLATDIALETGVSDKIAEKIAWTALYKTVNEEDMAPGYPAEAGYQLSGNLNLATVMFEANGENVTGMPAVNYTYDDILEIHDFYFTGDTFTLPADPTREGYSFEGWSVKVLPAENDADHLDADGADDAADETLLKAGDTYTITAGGVKFTAQWKKKTFTVKYYLPDETGTWVEKKMDTVDSVDYATYSLWTPNAEDGYEFSGWYQKTADIGVKAKVEKLYMAKEWKLYGKFTPIEYTIQYVYNDGKATSTNPTTYTVESDTITLADATGADWGKTFLEWHDENGQKITEIPTGSTGDRVITAYWNWPVHLHYLDKDNNEIESATLYVSELEPGACVLPTGEKTGYDFDGWYEAKKDIGTASHKLNALSIAKKWELYGRYTAKTDVSYTVKYLREGDNKVLAPEKVVTDQTFDTEVTEQAADVVGYTPDAPSKTMILDEYNKVLTFSYSANTYRYEIHYFLQEPDGSYMEKEVDTTPTGVFDTTVTITPDPNRYGAHYSYNSVKSVVSGVVTVDDPATILKLNVYYDLDFHTLTFDTMGGSAIDPVTVRHGNAVARPADPTKDKYTFIGWYVDPEFSAEYDFATVLEADKTIYAKFELTSTPIGDIYVRYDVLHIKQLPDGSYDLANAEVEHLSAKKDTTVTAVVKNYSATHHINVNSTLSKLTDTAIQPYPGADGKPVYTILSVYYDLDFHTLTFDTMGGSRIDPVTVRHGNAVAKPKDPVNGGYIFDGWYTDKTYRTPYNFATVLTQDTTIYAKWFLIALPGVTIKKTTPKLNTSDHFAYVQGYPDGTVKPTGNITRAETAAILFRLMDEGSRKTYYSTKSGFRDVATGSWYNTYVATLNNAGVITDSSNGYFRPNEAITRAELAAMLANFTETAGAANYFNDVSARYWAANAIAICAKLGWITGYPDGSFRPDRNVTRAELMAMINRATGRAPKSADAFLPGMKTWSDNTADKWYYLDVQEATNSHSYTVKDSEKWTALNADPNWSLYE